MTREEIRKRRRKLIRFIIYTIMSGKFLDNAVDPSKQYKTYDSVRKEYQSPYQRNDINYGYMTSAEVGTSNE
jgi:hypothetical protein